MTLFCPDPPPECEISHLFFFISNETFPYQMNVKEIFLTLSEKHKNRQENLKNVRSNYSEMAMKNFNSFTKVKENAQIFIN